MNKKYLKGVSFWSKDKMRLRVETIKDYAVSEKKLTAYFLGDNPFPCFHMTTTYSVLAAWLVGNGWKPCKTTVIVQITDTINPETGEITCHWEKVTINK